MSCTQCEPEGLPVGERRSIHHVAMRLGDGPHFNIFIGERDVSMESDEAIASTPEADGLVVLMPEPLTVCPCGNLVRDIYIGPDVRIEREVGA